MLRSGAKMLQYPPNSEGKQASIPQDQKRARSNQTSDVTTSVQASVDTDGIKQALIAQHEAPSTAIDDLRAY